MPISSPCTATSTQTLCEDVAACSFPSDLGWFALSYRPTSDGPLICRLVFGHNNQRSALARLERQHGRAALDAPSPPMDVEGWVDLLRRYAQGQPVSLETVRVDQAHLTPFGLRVAHACRKISWGSTCSYGQLAVAAGRAGAARAVGGVMAANRTPLVTPCHRVVGAGGRLGGFSAPQGVAMKRRLLGLEQQRLFA